MTELSFAVVVPSLHDSADALLESLRGQTFQPAELQVVGRTDPSGRARNLGAASTRSPFIVFVDDDALLAGPRTLENVVRALAEDASVGVSGAAKLLPPWASRFERAVARQVPRVVHPVVEEPLETNPPLGRHGYVEITSTCCAIRRDVLTAAGGFNEALVRGVDTELFYRVRRLGYRLVLVPNAWVYHRPPRTLGKLLGKHFLYGVGYAQEVQLDPDRAGRRLLRTPVHAVAYVALRTAGLLPHAFFPFTYARPSRRPAFMPLGALTSYAAALGYVYGWYRRASRRTSA